MPIFMDIHLVPGVKAKDVAEAHRKDLLLQGEHGCKCMTYWIDEVRENIFCLVEAPNKQAVEQMHSKAHGLMPNKIIEVSSKLVESFLGRIYDPGDAEITNDGLKVFKDPSFRVLMLTKTSDPYLLAHQLGSERAGELLSLVSSVIRNNIIQFNGREAEHRGTGFIVSFSSAANAVSCALEIQQEISADIKNTLCFKIAINAGEPVENSSQLFGDAIQFAVNMFTVTKPAQIAIASVVCDIVSKDLFKVDSNNIFAFSPQDEKLLLMLFACLEKNWQHAEFDIANYCQSMAMSKSQLYRKTISLTGLSPNILLKDYRLEKARELMKQQHYNIAQITFDSGFTSASYFTKCFKKKYGLLPMAYLDMMH